MFYILAIRISSQKCIIFAPRFTKNAAKLQKIFYINKLNLKIMKRLIIFLSRIDENNFIDLYYVTTIPAHNVRTIDSIMFHSKSEAQEHCDYLNKKYNTNIYYVGRTSLHI